MRGASPYTCHQSQPIFGGIFDNNSHPVSFLSACLIRFLWGCGLWASEDRKKSMLVVHAFLTILAKSVYLLNEPAY